MANNVRNLVFIQAPNKKRLSEVLEGIKGKDECIDFEKILPIPPKVRREDQTPEGEAQRWWCLKHWGTRHNAFDTEKITDELLAFQTKGRHPLEMVMDLSKQYPDVLFRVRYANENIGWDLGEYEIEANGVADAIVEQGTREARELALEIWYGDYRTE